MGDHFAELIPCGIEDDAIARFERHTESITGNKWKWSEASMEIRNRWRIKALLSELARLSNVDRIK